MKELMAELRVLTLQRYKLTINIMISGPYYKYHTEAYPNSFLGSIKFMKFVIFLN